MNRRGDVSHGASRAVRKTWGWRSRKALSLLDMAFLRSSVLMRDRYRCAYCGGEASTIDHIFSAAEGRRQRIARDDEAWIVACCADCNLRKGTGRRVPGSWAGRLAEIEERSGKRWLVWYGGKAPQEVLR